MRQGQGSKRSRGRGGGRRNAPQRHQNFDSNGPSIRIRGNANQVYEKYLQLARDAYTAGDRVTAENMFQHAEHYFRVLNVEERESLQARLQNQGNGEDGHIAPPPPPPPNRGNGAEHRHPPRPPRNDAPSRMEDSGAGDPVPAATGEQPARQHDAVDSTGGDAPGEEEAAPKRPQRRPRRNNGRAAPPSRETAEASSEKPIAGEDAPDASTAERKPDKITTATD